MQLRNSSEEAGTVRSLESLCQAWRESDPGQAPPHICQVLHVTLHHEDEKSFYSSEDSWEPVSLSVHTTDSLRNIGISVALIASLSILITIAIYLAIKFRNKMEVDSMELELDNLTGDKVASGPYPYHDRPPDYQAVLLMTTFKETDSLPDYEDEMVEKVIV